MSGIRVERHAVATSPHGIDTAVRGRSWKRTSCTMYAIGTRRSLPPRRTAPPSPRPLTIVFAVPRLSPAPPPKASSSVVAPGSAALSDAARQSLGTTSKPTPGMIVTPAACPSASLRAQPSKTAISPVMSR